MFWLDWLLCCRLPGVAICPTRCRMSIPVVATASTGTAPADPSSNLPELGQSTGHDPNEPREVTSLLARQLSAPVNFSEFPDLAAFSVRSDVIPRLRVEHANALRDPYYGPGSGPSFDSVLRRVSEFGILLDVG